MVLDTAYRSPAGAMEGMAWIPAGEFLMGSNAHYPEERPERLTSVSGFWMDRLAVTNDEFSRFVTTTGHVTTAEREFDDDEAPGLPAELRGPGSLVFRMTEGPVPLDDVFQWWSFVSRACWKHPLGPDSTLDGLGSHPVVHVSAADAMAYAAWAGKSLPTEAEWEFAARGSCPDRQVWPWGHHLTDDGKSMANTWQGEFPWQNLTLDGYAGTAPVHCYDPNGYGLYNMIGNVWEWTVDRYLSLSDQPIACCSGRRHNSADVVGPASARLVTKGGSYLCAPNYCRRYRPAARNPQDAGASTGHIGFRCVLRPVGG